MLVNDAIFKAYDIRGIYPKDINKENIVTIVKAIYTFFLKDLGKNKISVVLGRDMRVSSPSLFEAAKKTLVESGASVVDVGLVSTPTFYFAVQHYDYDTGIQISASHNPKEYNGIKFVKMEGQNIVKIGKNTGMEEVKQIALSQTFAESSGQGSVTVLNTVLKDEVDEAIKAFNPKNIKKFKVVADPANAMGALYLEELFKRLPCELVKMNFNLDGTFPVHQPDPLQFELLKDLQQKVIEEKADLGIAPDGDGDRVFFINEKGEIIPATLISSLIAKEILSQHKGEKILVDIRYIGNVKNIVAKYEGTVSISKVGHAFITEQLNKENAIFAGESSGHFFFRETGGAESSVRVILQILETMGREDKPISQVVVPFHVWQESGEINFLLAGLNKTQPLLEEIAKNYQDGQVSWLDGLAVDYSDWRFNIRASNTEPLLRLNLEAISGELMQQNLSKILDQLQQLGAARK